MITARYHKSIDKYLAILTTKPTGQGTGLGLSLSYDIITGHGGELKVKQRKEKEQLYYSIPTTIKMKLKKRNFESL